MPGSPHTTSLAIHLRTSANLLADNRLYTATSPFPEPFRYTAFSLMAGIEGNRPVSEP
nr:MAG TPA: hypothetical protein [Caudoviricetes sp.]